LPVIGEEPVFSKNSILFNETLINQTSSTIVGTQTIPSWNNAGRPEDAKTGTVGFNIQTGSLEIWNGNNWLRLPMKKI